MLKKFGLETSMFERLVSGGLEVVSLNEQWRMRSEFASLLSPIYPTLSTHPEVDGRNKVPIP
jgi:hypothetical protein